MNVLLQDFTHFRIILGLFICRYIAFARQSSKTVLSSHSNSLSKNIVQLRIIGPSLSCFELEGTALKKAFSSSSGKHFRMCLMLKVSNLHDICGKNSLKRDLLHSESQILTPPYVFRSISEIISRRVRASSPSKTLCSFPNAVFMTEP